MKQKIEIEHQANTVTEKDSSILNRSIQKSIWKKRSLYLVGGIAITVVTLFLIRSELRGSSSPEVTDTYNDPQLAFEETKKVLQLISKNFNKAKQEASKIKNFNEAKEKIKNQLSNQPPEDKDSAITKLKTIK